MKTGGNLVQILPPGINPGEAGEQLYSFNQRNLLTQYQVGAGSSVYNTVAEYSYDGGSNRLQQIDSSGTTPITTTYSNDNAGLSQVLVSNDGTTTTLNLFGLDLIQQDDGSETRTLLVDGLGSARVEMVGNTVETTTTYEPYGKLLVQNGNSGTTYGYTGEQYDAATSLVYLRARYYNHNLKVFMSHDPFIGWARLPASQNGYNYANNNPINKTDPSGLCAEIGDETCWALAERAWIAGLAPLEYLGTLSEAELKLILEETRFYCTENYGCFDTGHINPDRANEVLNDIERYLTTGQLIDLRGGFGLRSGFVAYYSVADCLPPPLKQGVALGILMDYERRLERLQGIIPVGPGAISSFAKDDLPSNYLGYVIGFNYSPEEQNFALFELFELLGGAKPVESLSHPKIFMSEINRLQGEGSSISTYPIKITNMEFLPLVEGDDGWQNISWPEGLRLTPIDSSSGLWQHERSGVCLLGVPWIGGDCG